MNEAEIKTRDAARQLALRSEVGMPLHCIREYGYGFDTGYAAAAEYYKPKWTVIRGADDLPNDPGNYFTTYFAPIRKKSDVCSLYWNGHSWASLSDGDQVVLKILAWKKMPDSYHEPYVEKIETSGGNDNVLKVN